MESSPTSKDWRHNFLHTSVKSHWPMEESDHLLRITTVNFVVNNFLIWLIYKIICICTRDVMSVVQNWEVLRKCCCIERPVTLKQNISPSFFIAVSVEPSFGISLHFKRIKEDIQGKDHIRVINVKNHLSVKVVWRLIDVKVTKSTDVPSAMQAWLVSRAGRITNLNIRSVMFVERKSLHFPSFSNTEGFMQNDFSARSVINPVHQQPYWNYTSVTSATLALTSQKSIF